jgi:hypothetical protein
MKRVCCLVDPPRNRKGARLVLNATSSNLKIFITLGMHFLFTPFPFVIHIYILRFPTFFLISHHYQDTAMAGQTKLPEIEFWNSSYCFPRLLSVPTSKRLLAVIRMTSSAFKSLISNRSLFVASL